MFLRHLHVVLPFIFVAITAMGFALAWPLDLATRHTVARAETKATGSLTVKIRPKAARPAGARWRVDGGAWKRSGRTIEGLTTGQHMVSFKNILDWSSPADKKVNVIGGQTKSVSGRYAVPLTEAVMLPGDVPLEMVWITAGSFMMGRYTSEQDSSSNESPQHSVTFANGFWMGKYEVTKAQWQAVMNTTPWLGQSQVITDPASPAVYISWNDAHAFMDGLNQYASSTFYLPSEAQLEYACRAGKTARFYWGEDPSYAQINDYAWWYGNAGNVQGHQFAHIVGLKLPNGWGFFDTSGNAWEWCEDWYHENYTGAPTDGSAWVSPTGTYRAFHGGGFGSGGSSCRSASRSGALPNYSDRQTGFRVAR